MKKTNSSTSQKRPDSSNKTQKQGSRMIPLIRALGYSFNTIVAVCLIISSFSGYFEPVDNRLLSIIGFAFPICLCIELLFVMCWILFKQWKYALIFFIPIIICWEPSATVFPLNILKPRLSEYEKQHRFSLLSYNIYQFYDNTYSKLDYNPTISEILRIDADVVVLQEYYSIEASRETHITKVQSDSIKHRYPYRAHSCRDLGILSKFPIFENSDISGRNEDFNAAKYRLKIFDDSVTIYNLHLKSIGFTRSDKKLYRQAVSKEIIHETSEQLKELAVDIKHKIYNKLSDASIDRARQAQVLASHLKKEKNNVIVCGDFNDIVTSYSYLKIRGSMHDAYQDCGFGPTITYNANRFYFKIDHILYQGNIKAVDNIIGNVKWSDHYPTITEFVITK